MAKRPCVKTVSQTVKLLGGPANVARWLHVSEGSVLNWIVRGRVARGLRLHVYLSLQARGYDCVPSILGAQSWGDLLVPVQASNAPCRDASHKRSRAASTPMQH